MDWGEGVGDTDLNAGYQREREREREPSPSIREALITAVRPQETNDGMKRKRGESTLTSI